jgi:hypothetical protein
MERNKGFVMPKEAEKEKIADKQFRAMIIVAVISSATTFLVGIITAFFAFPPFQEWVRNWGDDQKAEILEIEQIPQRVFAYYGEAENSGGFGRLDLTYDGVVEKPSYELGYNLPVDMKGYAGLAFQFDEGSNLTRYKAVECTVIFNQTNDIMDLYFKDIAGSFNTIRVSNNGADEMKLRYEFANFPDINFNAVKEFGIVVSTDFTTSSHKVRIQDVNFIK